jgi:hypothetical protein
MQSAAITQCSDLGDDHTLQAVPARPVCPLGLESLTPHRFFLQQLGDALTDQSESKVSFDIASRLQIQLPPTPAAAPLR